MVSPNTAFVVIYVLVAIIFPFLAFTVANFLRPKRSNSEKTTTYESGMTTRGGTWVRFRAQYFIYALLFVLFDVETVFLYPWAVAYNRMGLFALVEGFLFVGILAFGLAYAWRKGDLRWT